MAKINEVAAYFHRRMCNDDRFGYTQGDARWGDSNYPEWWEYDGVSGLFWVGDRDCSSSVIDAWNEALRDTPFANSLANAYWTGNIAEVFTDSGLFEIKPSSFLAETGDLYLVHNNYIQHVSMCQTQYPDILSEFIHNEYGGVVDGVVGDQTGGEALVHEYWEPSCGYDCIIHYNGKADNIDSKLEFEGSGAYTCIADALAVKSSPSVKANTVATYYYGEVVYLDSFSTENDDYIWGRYTSWNGNTRFIAIGKADGSERYLARC